MRGVSERGRAVMALIESGLRPCDIVTRKTLGNAAVVVGATGDSTNAGLRLTNPGAKAETHCYADISTKAGDMGGREAPPILKDFFGRAERYAYVAVGGLLVLATLVALAGSLLLLWRGVLDWSGTNEVFETVDRLLFVLMLVEILHTVSASVRTGSLTVQPFLIVGLIACIRRILVITLETSESMRGRTWNDTVSAQFHASMLELGVLGGLILVMIASIFLLHQIPEDSKKAE